MVMLAVLMMKTMIRILLIITIIKRQFVRSRNMSIKSLQHTTLEIKFRVRPKFGFGYGAETDLTYGFGLVSATAKMHWHRFGFGRNIAPKPPKL